MTKIAYFGVAVLPPHQLFLDMVAHARKVKPSIDQACDLVLGQLSPATDFDGSVYPNGYGSDELFRLDAANQAVVDVRDGSEVLLRDLLEYRVGTPASYSICLGYVLFAAGFQPVELAITGPDAVKAQLPFVICDGRQIDLFARATGDWGDPNLYRPHKRVQIEVKRQ